MNVKTILVVATLGCLVAVVFVKQSPQSEPSIERLSLRSIDLTLADSIEVKSANPILLTKEKGGWFLPSGRRAEHNAVKRALDALNKVESSTKLASTIAPESLKKWGLDEEKGTTVTVKAGSDVLVELTLGKVTVGRVPLLVNGAIFSAKGIFPGVFSKTAQSWLEKRLFPNSAIVLDELHYSHRGVEIYGLMRAPDPKAGFVFPQSSVLPDGFRFDAEIARSVTSTLMGLRVQSFVNTDLGAEVTGLNEASDRLSFVYGEGGEGGRQEETLVLGGPAEGRGIYAYLEGRKTIVVLPAGSVEVFRKSLEDFRDLRLMNLDPRNIAKLVIQDGKSRVILAKKGDQWTLDESSQKPPEGFEFDAALVPRRLSRLANIRAVGMAKPAPKSVGFVGAKASVTALLADTTEIKLEFGNKSTFEGKAGFYAKGNADELVYVVSDSTRKNALGMLASFAKRPAPKAIPNDGKLDLSKLPPDIRQQLMKKIQGRKSVE